MNTVDQGLWAVDPEEADFDDHRRKSRDRWLATYSMKALKQGAAVDARIVKHQRFDELIAALDRMFLLAKEVQQPVGGIIRGTAGVGKSTLCRYFMDTLPHHNLAERSAGMIFIRMRRGNSLAGVVQQVLKQLNYPLLRVNSTTLDAKRSLSVDALRRHKTRLLLVDEGQQIVAMRGARTGDGSAASEYFRELMDEAKLAVCLVGGPNLSELKTVDPYLDSRCVVNESLRDFAMDADWLSLAQAMLPESSSLNLRSLQSSREGFQALHKTARGNLRRLKQFLTELAMVTVDSGKVAPEKATLQLAFQRAFGSEERSDCPWT
jgi:hypothetical protein